MSSHQINIAKVFQGIENATEKSARPSKSVRLLAVSKTRSCTEITQAYEQGVTAFGENYLQEALQKIHTLGHLPIEWHFIGAVQSNKTTELATHFSWIHSLCRLKIAKRLSQQRPHALGPLNCCLQVNIDQEHNKSGLLADAVLSFARKIIDLPQLRLRGLMAIPMAHDDPQAVEPSFAQLAQLFRQLQQEFPDECVDTLSMGMSNDFELAIAQGATLVRLGRSVFAP